MPRYFFHLHEEEGGSGEDLPDDAAARSIAHETLGEMIRDNPAVTALRMRVTDDRGRQVAKLAFSAE
jgi:hypothetical protein